MLTGPGPVQAAPYLPSSAWAVYRRELEIGRAPCRLETLERGILYRLRTMGISDFNRLRDVSEGLGERLMRAARSATSLRSFLCLCQDQAVRARTPAPDSTVRGAWRGSRGYEATACLPADSRYEPAWTGSRCPNETDLRFAVWNQFLPSWRHTADGLRRSNVMLQSFGRLAYRRFCRMDRIIHRRLSFYNAKTDAGLWIWRLFGQCRKSTVSQHSDTRRGHTATIFAVGVYVRFAVAVHDD